MSQKALNKFFGNSEPPTDQHDHFLFDSVEIACSVSKGLLKRLGNLGIRIIPKKIDYELIRADTVPFEIDLTSDLGDGANDAFHRDFSKLFIVRQDGQIKQVKKWYTYLEQIFFFFFFF